MTRYRLIYTLDDGTRGVSCDAYGGPRTLDSALDHAAELNRIGMGPYYTLEPIPGTEPRYTLMVSGPNGRGCAESWPKHIGVPWAEAKAAYDYKTSQYARFADADSHWPLTYRVVQA